eukprot:5679329-Prymnesium_polylepis.1
MPPIESTSHLCAGGVQVLPTAGSNNNNADKYSPGRANLPSRCGVGSGMGTTPCMGKSKFSMQRREHSCRRSELAVCACGLWTVRL